MFILLEMQFMAHSRCELDEQPVAMVDAPNMAARRASLNRGN
jgi:hypothetical protein